MKWNVTTKVTITDYDDDDIALLCDEVLRFGPSSTLKCILIT